MAAPAAKLARYVDSFPNHERSDRRVPVLGSVVSGVVPGPLAESFTVAHLSTC